MAIDPKGKEGALILQAGEVIRADVLRDLGDGKWVLGLLGVEIAFPSLTPLQVGTTITLRAEVSSQGVSCLRLVEGDQGASPKKEKARNRSSKKRGIDYRV